LRPSGKIGQERKRLQRGSEREMDKKCDPSDIIAEIDARIFQKQNLKPEERAKKGQTREKVSKKI